MGTERRKRRPSRGTLGLTRHRIAAAALAIVDQEGAEALTARRLASAVGCQPMSLYHHFAGMDDVLDAVADLLLAKVDISPAAPPADLRGELRALAESYLRLSVSHPRAFPLLATRRLRSPTAFALVGGAVRVFAAGGLGAREALRTVRILAAYLNGAGLALAAWELDPHPVDDLARSAAAGLDHLHGHLDLPAVATDLEAGLDLVVEAIASGLASVPLSAPPD
jgi:AcrR family transcriptional regulator